MGDQYKLFIQDLVNPLDTAGLEAQLDSVVSKNDLAYWRLLQRQVIDNSHEHFVVCLGQDSRLPEEDEIQLLQNTLLENASDVAEVGANRKIINYWNNYGTDSNLSYIDHGCCEEQAFSYATLRTPFINGTEYILVFKSKDSRISDELTGNLVSAFLVAWCSINSFPEFRNVKQVRLGKRERQVLSWTSQGKTSYEISKILNLSEHTINNYVTNAANKLGTNNRVHTVCRAVMLGLI